MTRIVLTVLIATTVGLTLGCSDMFDTTAQAQDSHSASSGHDHDDDDHGHAHASETDDDHAHETGAVAEDGHDHEEGEHPFVMVTQWSDGMELFMEYPVLVAGEGGRFIIHLTHLDNFQPVREGNVELIFRDSHGHGFTVNESTLLREGIFTPTVEIDHAGQFDFTLIYTGENCEAAFDIDGFVVAQTEHDLPDPSEPDDNLITFLKEQQWKIPFATNKAELRPMRSAVSGVATIGSPPDASYTLVAPVAGVVSSDYAPASGQIVSEGDVLLTLLPQIDTGGSWVDVQAQLEQASSDWDRAQRLFAQNAISEREYDQIRLHYETLQTGLDSATGKSSDARFMLRAPVSATVAECLITPGEAVEVGQPLIRLVQRDYYRVTAHMYELPEGGAESISGMSLYLPGMDKSPVVFNDIDPVASPVIVDRATQTIPVQLDIIDSSTQLQLGQRVRVDLYGSVNQNSLTVPESSIFLDEGMDVVYVQVSGESFEKRIVVTGARDGGWVVINGDIRPGEYAVSTGGYHVKLASMSGAIGHGHAH